jgi:hypothetical protein
MRVILKAAGKEMCPPPLPDTLPGTTIKALSKDELDALVELRKKAAELPAIEDVNDFMAEPLEKPKMLVDGILHQGSKLSLGGGSKSFKTWMLLDLALSVATGSSWLGFATTKARVLFCNREIQREFMQERIKAIERAKVIRREPGCLDLWNLRGCAAPYNVIIPLILERIKNQNYGLIVLDPIYKLYGDTDENSAGDVAALMNAIETLAVKSKAAVVFGAHFSKGNQAGKDSIDRVSGSGVYGRDPDSLISVTKHEEENAFVVDTNLRNLAPVCPFVIRWEFPLMQRDETLNPLKLKSNLSKTAQYTVDDLLRVLVVESRTKKDLRTAVMQETEMSATTFHNLFQRLEETGDNASRWILRLPDRLAAHCVQAQHDFIAFLPAEGVEFPPNKHGRGVTFTDKHRPLFAVKDLLAVAVQNPVTITDLKKAVKKGTGMDRSTFINLLQEFKCTSGNGQERGHRKIDLLHPGSSENHLNMQVGHPPPNTRRQPQTLIRQRSRIMDHWTYFTRHQQIRPDSLKVVWPMIVWFGRREEKAKLAEPKPCRTSKERNELRRADSITARWYSSGVR